MNDDNTEFDIQQKMANLFEKIIETQLDNIVENNQPVGEPTQIPRTILMRQGLKRDFRNIFISRDEYLRVCKKGGAFSLLYDCGSGSYTNWFLYNSEKRNRLFMVWLHQTNPSVLDFQTDEYLGVLREERETEETKILYELCFQQYFNNLKPLLIENSQKLTPSLLKSAHNVGVLNEKMCNKIIGGFRDDISRITQL